MRKLSICKLSLDVQTLQASSAEKFRRISLQLAEQIVADCIGGIASKIAHILSRVKRRSEDSLLESHDCGSIFEVSKKGMKSRASHCYLCLRWAPHYAGALLESSERCERSHCLLALPKSSLPYSLPPYSLSMYSLSPYSLSPSTAVLSTGVLYLPAPYGPLSSSPCPYRSLPSCSPPSRPATIHGPAGYLNGNSIAIEWHSNHSVDAKAATALMTRRNRLIRICSGNYIECSVIQWTTVQLPATLWSTEQSTLWSTEQSTL